MKRFKDLVKTYPKKERRDILEFIQGALEDYGHDNNIVEIITIYLKDHEGSTGQYDFGDSYQGTWDSKLDYTYSFVDDCYNLDELMGNLACYFDYEKLSRDIFMSDCSSYTMKNYNVVVFRNC